MQKLQVYKQKTVLVKWNGEKIVVDIPYDAVKKAMEGTSLQIGKEHVIRTSAINEYYGYSITDELEAWIYEEYPDQAENLLKMVRKRKDEGKRVNKEIVANIVNGDK